MRPRDASILLALASLSCAPSPRAVAPERAESMESDDALDRTGGEDGDDPGADATDASSPGATTATAGDAVLAEATRIFATARATTYQHKTEVDEATATFDVDCSGFVGYVLGRVAPDAKRELRAATVKRPLAKHYTEFFQSLPIDAPKGHWRRVVRAVDLRPGDIVAWKRAPDSHSKNTGHTMIVRAPVVAHDGVVEVPIFDSTATRHGRDDARAAASRSGVGRGTIALRVAADGSPIAFRWAVTGKYRENATEIALGRVE